MAEFGSSYINRGYVNHMQSDMMQTQDKMRTVTLKMSFLSLNHALSFLGMNTSKNVAMSGLSLAGAFQTIAITSATAIHSGRIDQIV